MAGPLRVLVVTSNYPRRAGDSTTPFVHHLALDLAARGLRLEVLAPHDPGAARREVLDGVPVVRFHYFRPERLQRLCYRGGALVNLRRSTLARLQVPLLVVCEFLALWRALRGGRFDLVHAHWLLPQGLVAVLAGRLRGVPVVVTAHGGDLFALRAGWLAPLKRFALRRAAAVTVNSAASEAAVRALAPELAGDPARLHRIPMGVSLEPPDPAAVAALRRRHRRGAGPLLVFVGRLVAEKGLAELIEAMARLGRGLPDAACLVLGEGQERARFEALAGSRGVAERIRFLGWVAPESVPAHLAAADCCVVPSRSAPDGWIEAQGLAVLEAMAAGTPVIASRLGGLAEAVTDGETGLLVPPGDPHALAAAIRRLAAEPALGARLAAAARERVAAGFSRAASAEAFAALMGEVVASEPRTSSALAAPGRVG